MTIESLGQKPGSKDQQNPKPFSPELHKKFLDKEQHINAMATLENLRKKLELKGGLFTEQEEREFEFMKEMEPEAWEMIENADAFKALTPEEQKQVLFRIYNNGAERPKNPKMHHLDR